MKKDKEEQASKKAAGDKGKDYIAKFNEDRAKALAKAWEGLMPLGGLEGWLEESASLSFISCHYFALFPRYMTLLRISSYHAPCRPKRPTATRRRPAPRPGCPRARRGRKYLC